MRIIRDASKEIEKTIICTNCGSELGYLPKDITEDVRRGYDTSCEVYRYITCHVCNKHLIVK